MAKLISIHSYRGGTGKSNLSANLAYLAARAGKRVAVMDTDVQSPGVHMLLGLPSKRQIHSLSDYLFGKCDLEEAAYDLSGELELVPDGGVLYLLPSSMSVDAIVRVVSEGYDAGRLNDQLHRLCDDLKLDFLIIDTHPGLTRETMLTTAISDVLVVVIRPDTQDFHGTAVLMEVAGKLGVPTIRMLINKVVDSLDPQDVRQKVQDAFGHPVIGVLPYSQSMMELGSRGLIAKDQPQHPFSAELSEALNRLLGELDAGRG